MVSNDNIPYHMIVASCKTQTGPKFLYVTFNLCLIIKSRKRKGHVLRLNQDDFTFIEEGWWRKHKVPGETQ